MVDLDEQFFIECLKWKSGVRLVVGKGVYKYVDSNGEGHNTLPGVSSCWNEFHKWVVPKLMKQAYKHLGNITMFRESLGFYFSEPNGTPAEALEWAMEEIKDANK